MILGLLDVLRAYPGQIPDVDAVLSVADFPCVPMCVSPATLQRRSVQALQASD